METKRIGPGARSLRLQSQARAVVVVKSSMYADDKRGPGQLTSCRDSAAQPVTIGRPSNRAGKSLLTTTTRKSSSLAKFSRSSKAGNKTKDSSSGRVAEPPSALAGAPLLINLAPTRCTASAQRRVETAPHARARSPTPVPAAKQGFGALEPAFPSPRRGSAARHPLCAAH